jgi:AraC-like DNA-binding protein
MVKYSETIIKSDRSCCLYNEYFRRSVEGEVYELDSVGFRLWHFVSNKGFKSEIDLPLANDSILMCFCTKGKIDLKYSIAKKMPFIEQNHNLIFLPNHESVSFLAADSSIVEIFAVILQSDMFFSYFPVDGSPLFMDFKRKVQKEKEAAFLHSTNFQLSWDMKLLINNIIESDRVDECKHIYFKAKIIELLGLQLEQFIMVNPQEDRFKSLKKDEVERIKRVKDILCKNPEKSYTLLGLAHSVGTNDSTLKKHFKMVYGTTVFNYLNRCRMEKAHHILQNNDYKISHVAEEVGFRYASHFSTAFKKHYGYSPAVLRNVN